MQTQQPFWQFFLLSFFSLLAIRYASSTSTAPQIVDAVAPSTCQTNDQPNPIASLYPNNVTGVLNGTIAVVPISLDLARQLIPSQYRILEHAYRHLLPSFPKNMYPAVVQAIHDHDIQSSGFTVPDFSRAGIEFPFIDLLGDNTTSFKWVPSLLLSSDNALALQGAQAYGITTYPATFTPTCDAYSGVPDTSSTTVFTSRSNSSTQAGATRLDTRFSTTSSPAYPLSFYVNITNQVIFADGKSCDNMIRLFNTSLTTANTVDEVKGTVRASMPPFDSEQVWRGVHGVRLATAFIENNYLPCGSFRGYGS